MLLIVLLTLTYWVKSQTNIEIIKYDSRSVVHAYIHFCYMHLFHPHPLRVSTLSKWQPDSSELHLILMALKIHAEQR